MATRAPTTISRGTSHCCGMARVRGLREDIRRLKGRERRAPSGVNWAMVESAGSIFAMNKVLPSRGICGRLNDVRNKEVR